jgi:HTH-type transcriptional regulator, competence development regulator
MLYYRLHSSDDILIRLKPLHTKQTFGRLIKKLRIENTDASLRQLAATIGISPAYLSRLESDRDPPPSEAVIIKLAEALGTDSDELLGHADKVSPDLLNIIKDNPKSVPSFLRLTESRRLSERDWKKISSFVESKKLGKKQHE